MNKNIFEAHLNELLKILSNEKISSDLEIKNKLLIDLEIQIEMCDLITNKYQKDYSREKEVFSEIMAFVLLNQFVQAIEYINEKIKKL